MSMPESNGVQSPVRQDPLDLLDEPLAGVLLSFRSFSLTSVVGSSLGRDSFTRQVWHLDHVSRKPGGTPNPVSQIAIGFIDVERNRKPDRSPFLTLEGFHRDVRPRRNETLERLDQSDRDLLRSPDGSDWPQIRRDHGKTVWACRSESHPRPIVKGQSRSLG